MHIYSGTRFNAEQLPFIYQSIVNDYIRLVLGPSLTAQYTISDINSVLPICQNGQIILIRAYLSYQSVFYHEGLILITRIDKYRSKNPDTVISLYINII